MSSLLELQRTFANALRDPRVTCAVSPAANLAIYRNNSDSTFVGALEIAFPVLRRRVGEDYFRQLVARYREAFPSRSGDLHWIGRSFAEFLAHHLRGGDYAWLADLARLEWACEEAAIEPELEALAIGELAAFAPEDLERLGFSLQPSVRLVSAPFPVFSVWAANQSENAPPVDQSVGSERGVILIRSGAVEVRKLEPDLFACLEATRRGFTLGEAMEQTDLDERRLTDFLSLLFSTGLVVSMRVTADEERSPDGQRVGTSS